MEARHEDTDTEENSDDVWVCNDTTEEFWCKFALEEEDAVREEGDIKSNNEATVWNDALFAKGARNDWVAKEGGVIKDKCKLRLKTKFAFIETFVEYGTTEQDEHKHHKDAGEEAFEKEL